MFDREERQRRLFAVAETDVDVELANITREYPVAILLTAEGPGPIPSHRELDPAFYGSFDWHSCVELHWVAARLIREFPGLPNEQRARDVLNSLITPEHLEQALKEFAQRERRYGGR